MTAEATLRSYVDAFNRADVKALAAHYAPSTEYRQPFLPEPLTTPEAVEGFESAMFSGFSDVRVEVQWLVADGPEAAAGARITARHTADMPLPDGNVIPASGITITIHTAEHVRVDGEGRIVEHRRYSDPTEMMSQLTAAALDARRLFN